MSTLTIEPSDTGLALPAEEVIRLASELTLCDLSTLDAEQSRRSFIAGDGAGFAAAGYERHCMLDLIILNASTLKRRGIYETALLEAFTGCKLNNGVWPADWIEDLFVQVDRDRMRALGSPLPMPEVLTVYRGISGSARSRRCVRGMSWTLDLDHAAWFAVRAPRGGTNPDPSIYAARIRAEDVYVYANARGEQEVICRPAKGSVKRLAMTPDQVADTAMRFQNARHKA